MTAAATTLPPGGARTMPFNILFDQFGGQWDGRKRVGAGGGFSPNEQLKVREAVRDAVAFSTLAKASADTSFLGKRDLLKTWFGSDGPSVIKAAQSGINKMHAALVDGARTVRFVDARHQSEKLYRSPQVAAPGVAGAHGAKVTDRSEAPSVVPMGASDYAYVKCLADHDPTAALQAHVGSGMRIYLGERMFHPSKKLIDRSLTIYHELNHKVLGTVDFGTYGPGPSKSLAAGSTERALKHAECWTFFAASFRQKF
jgi:hypothetical protein